MSTAEELFQTLGIDVFSLINDNCKYLPESFFELSKQDSIEISVNPDNSVYKSLPLRIWDIRNIRNGKQAKSEIQDITLNETLLEPIQARIVNDFTFYHYGDELLVKRDLTGYKLKIDFFRINRNVNQMKDLPKLEFLNLLYNLKTRNANNVYTALDRVSSLFHNSIAENTVQPEIRAMSQSMRGFEL